MGVDLASFTSPVPLSWSELAGKKLAVDGNNTLYQFLSSVRQADGTPLMDSKGRITGHLAGVFYRCAKWLEYGVRPIFIFDGKPPELKRRTLDERKARKETARANWQEAIDSGRIEDAHRFAQATSALSREMSEQARTLLCHMGIQSLVAPSEGEAQAAAMALNGSVWASASQDYDSFLFGTPRLVRNLSTSGRRKVHRKDEYVDVAPELLLGETVLANAKLSREQLIWLAILMGTDFNEGVNGIGPKKGMKFVEGASSWKEVAARLTQNGIAHDGAEDAEEIEQFFLHPPVVENPELPQLSMDGSKTADFLCNEFEFSRERVERTLSALAKKMKETGAQSKLGDW